MRENEMPRWFVWFGVVMIPVSIGVLIWFIRSMEMTWADLLWPGAWAVWLSPYLNGIITVLMVQRQKQIRAEKKEREFQEELRRRYGKENAYGKEVQGRKEKERLLRGNGGAGNPPAVSRPSPLYTRGALR